MAGSILLRSAYHHRLVGYGDFLRKHATPAADSQSVSGRVPTDADGANVATASSSRASEAQTSPGPASQEGRPSLGMGLQNVAELLSREARPEITASAAEGTKAQGKNNTNKQHSCKCGICDACKEPHRPPTPTCHHVACHSQRECTIFPGHVPVRFVHQDNRETARIDWLPTNFCAKEAPAQSEQVSQIKSSFKLDEDRELITTITSAVQSGMKALQRQNATRVRDWKSRRTLDIGEDLFKAGLLSKESPLFDIISSHFDGKSSSGSGSSSSSSPSSNSGDDKDEGVLRFQALLICGAKVDKMVRDGEITEEQKPQVLVKQVEKVLQGLSNPKGKKRAKGKYPAHAQFRDERLEMAKARAARSVRAAAHGSEPMVRSRLSGEVWNASPTKPASRDDDVVDSQIKLPSTTETPSSDPNNHPQQHARGDMIAFLSAMDSFSSSPSDSNVTTKQVKSQPGAIESTPNPGSERDDKQDPIDDIIAVLSAMSTAASSSAPKRNVPSSQAGFQSATVEDMTEPNSENDYKQGGDASDDKTNAQSTTVGDASDKTTSSNEQPKLEHEDEETSNSDQQTKSEPGGETSHHVDEDDDSDEEEVILFKGRRHRS